MGSRLPLFIRPLQVEVSLKTNTRLKLDALRMINGAMFLVICVCRPALKRRGMFEVVPLAQQNIVEMGGIDISEPGWGSQIIYGAINIIF